MAQDIWINVKAKIRPSTHRQAVALARKSGLPREKIYAMAIAFAVQSGQFKSELLNLELLIYRPNHPAGLD